MVPGPVSGEEAVDARFEAVRAALAVGGEETAVSAWCGVDMGRSSGMSSSSCRGLGVFSW